MCVFCIFSLMMKQEMKNKYFLATAIIIGLVLRLIHLYFFQRSPLFYPSGLDELYHHLWALRIADGEILPKAAFFRAPLYPYLIGMCYAIFGKSLLIARIPGIISGIFTIWLTFLVTYKIKKSNKAALIAAFLTALNPILIYFESRLLLDYMLVPFGLAILLFALKWFDDRQYRWLFISGLFSGLFAITRPTILLFMPIFSIWLLIILW